ncbi:MAG TPA: hypothetical protein VNQ33_01355 [Acidimicrobiales bacterium]|nr:hypothetical protein [Acidimicrobiales bacterium]
MATITVRLDADDERMLDELAEIHGDRSTVVREAIRQMAASETRREGLGAFLDDWERELGPIDHAQVDEIVRRLQL